jgi:phage portal protein BeeE
LPRGTTATKGEQDPRHWLEMEGGTTYKQTGLSQKDMDLLEQRKFKREEIMAALKKASRELVIYKNLF